MTLTLFFYLQVPMASHNCNVCKFQHKTNVPEVWCPICEEFLCSTCSQHHKAQRLTREHTTISYDDYYKLPPFILNVQLICGEHKENFLYYCRSHDCPLCKKCLSKSHKKCDDTLDIDDVVHNVKSSAVFEDVWRDLKAAHLTFLNAVMEREENLDNLKRRKDILSADVKERTKRLVDHLKELENKALAELDSVFNKNVNDIRETTTILLNQKKKS